MQLNAVLPRPSCLLAMKLFILLMAISSLQVSGAGYGQLVTLHEENASLEQVFKSIHKQTGVSFVYARDQLKHTRPVTISVVNAALPAVLAACFRNQPITYVLEGNYVVVQRKQGLQQAVAQPDTLPVLRGHIVNEQAAAVAGATIRVKGTNLATSSDDKGDFVISVTSLDVVLIISSTNAEPLELAVNGRASLPFIVVQTRTTNLDAVLINKGYYTTSRKLNTGSVSKVTAEEINRQPVANPITALQGRVPGLLITQRNGLPGGNLVVQIRGQNSIQQGNEPLYIVDGAPFGSENLLRVGAGLNANNPFNTINPLDIESIEVLKDADATAIYGSRGANGVILISTKKAKTGKISVNASAYRGWSRVTRTMDFMNTAQYLEMRREAFKNDAATPTVADALDLTQWDTTRYTDWKKKIIGNTAELTNVQASMTGGNKQLGYLLSSGYYSESTVVPGNSQYSRGSVALNVTNSSENGRFSAVVSSSYSFDNNNMPSQDMMAFTNQPPNMYLPYDSIGKLQWGEGGISYGNVFSFLLQTHHATADRLLANVNLAFKITGKLSLRTNFNYNSVDYKEKSTRPIASQDPFYNPRGSASFGNTSSKTWNIEPQLDYHTALFPKGKLQLLVGSTWQQKKDGGIYLFGSGYTNDAQINSIAGAGTITIQNDYGLYKFSSGYGRLNYNWDDKYLVNFVARQDASSRFGTGNRVAGFAAVGAAWLFSSERLVKKHLDVLSFGKLRASYGTTGNDRIGDYQYLDSWTNTANAYQGQTGLRPTRLYNPHYGWEEIRKLDLGLDLAFFKGRLSLTADWFRHRSSNQLISSSLPDQTGFTSIIRNIPAVIQNKGLELSITSVNVKGKDFSWNATLNVTVQRNKLLAFEGLATSNYATRYIIGKPISLNIGYTYLGIDPATGVYRFDDKNKDGLLNNQDYSYQGTTNPDFFGGLNNIFNYKHFELSFLFEFRKQTGRHAIFGYSYFPGSMVNQPVAVLDRWRKAGDVSTYQQFTQSYGSAAALAAGQAQNSSAAWTDASFVRLKNLALYYSLPATLTRKIKSTSVKVFLQGQNLLTLTDYIGADPENQSMIVLPPLRVLTAGMNIHF